MDIPGINYPLRPEQAFREPRVDNTRFQGKFLQILNDFVAPHFLTAGQAAQFTPEAQPDGR